MDEGKALCEKGAFSEAIEKYTQVLQSKVVDDARDAEVHWLRSHTYCQMCDDLRSRPAQASERHALFGFDIHQIAEMAFSDAEKARKTKVLSEDEKGMQLGGIQVFWDTWTSDSAPFAREVGGRWVGATVLLRDE